MVGSRSRLLGDGDGWVIEGGRWLRDWGDNGLMCFGGNWFALCFELEPIYAKYQKSRKTLYFEPNGSLIIKI